MDFEGGSRLWDLGFLGYSICQDSSNIAMMIGERVGDITCKGRIQKLREIYSINSCGIHLIIIACVISGEFFSSRVHIPVGIFKIIKV